MRLMSNPCQQTYPPAPVSLRTWLIDLPPWVTDVPSRGHHNGRVMREWWDLPTASSARPFACEVRCRREQDLRVAEAPGLGGSAGDELQTKEGQEVFNQAALQDSDFILDGIGMKNQNNKTEINRQQPGGVQTPWWWSEDGAEWW